MKQSSSAMHAKWIIILDSIAFIIDYLTSLRYFSIFFVKEKLFVLVAVEMRWTEEEKAFSATWRSDQMNWYEQTHFNTHTYAIHNQNIDGFLLVSFFYCFRALIRVLVCLVVKKIEETGM